MVYASNNYDLWFMIRNKKISSTMWGPRKIAKLIYNSNNYGLWYL